MQGALITDGQNSCKWTGPTVGLFKSFIRVKISGQNFEKYFLMDSFIERKGYRSHFCIRLLVHFKTFKMKASLYSVLSLVSVYLKMAKNGHVHEGRKVGK